GFAPLVMKWQNIFRYAQDIWAPMAAPIVVVFVAGALWVGATERGALACLWLAIFSVPLVLAKAILADANVHFVPANLENPMVLAGAVALISMAMMICLSWNRGMRKRQQTQVRMSEPALATAGLGVESAGDK